MSLRSVYFIVTMMLAASTLYGQVRFTFRTGYGSFSMAEMKKYQDDLALGFPVSPEITSQFPSYFVYDAGVDALFDDNVIFGMSVSRGSTGGRVHYSDYSGEIGSDQLLSYTAVGMNIGTQLVSQSGRLVLSAFVRPSIVITKFTASNYSTIGSEHRESSRQYNSFNTMLQPTVDITFRHKQFGFGVYSGYNLTVRKSFLANSGSSLSSTLPDETYADWSGVRVGAGVSYYTSTPLVRKDEHFEKASIGLGIGLDHGGIGFQAAMYPLKSVGIFLGVGYAFAGVGVNTGLKFREYDPRKVVNIFGTVMYGYNTAVYVAGTGSYDKFFYNPSFGAGVDYRPWGAGREYFSFGLIAPVRSVEVEKHKQFLTSQHGITFGTQLPILFSLGFQFGAAKEADGL